MIDPDNDDFAPPARRPADAPQPRDGEDVSDADMAQLILEASPAYLIRCSVKDGEVEPISYVSSNIDRFGFSREELLSSRRSLWDLVHPDDRDRAKTALREAIDAGRDACALDYRQHTADDRVRHVTSQIQLRRDDAGRVVAIQALVLDATEIVLACRDLEMVLDSAPIPIVKVRVENDGDRRLEYQNPAAERLFGKDATGLSCKNSLCNKETCPVLADESGLVRERECLVNTLVGQRVMYKTARRLPGSPSIIEAMIDVTELMRTRQRLTRAMEAAEAANRAKSQFLATMSHEIRTPMNGIMGMIELALATELTPEQHDYLDLARQSAVHLLEIINDILDFSRIEAGRMELARSRFSLRQALGVCLRLFEAPAERSGNRLSLDIAPDVPDDLVGDPGRLAQIVANLVSNGLKFTKNGFVRVAVGLDPDVSRKPGAISLRFDVSDDGIGIPSDQQARIFDYFTQLDASLNRGAGGTGLGLSISKNLVNLMGGRIWVASNPGRGSTFSFTAGFCLPEVQPETAAAPPVPAEPAAPIVPLRLLLVEDNTINQIVAKRLLERRGHMVTAADNGRHALAALAETPFDCVLMDVEMPELNGPDTLALLRDPARFGPAAATPAVALTAHAVKGYRERMLQAGFDDYVAKPIDMHELDAALARIAARRDMRNEEKMPPAAGGLRPPDPQKG